MLRVIDLGTQLDDERRMWAVWDTARDLFVRHDDENAWASWEDLLLAMRYDGWAVDDPYVLRVQRLWDAVTAKPEGCPEWHPHEVRQCCLAKGHEGWHEIRRTWPSNDDGRESAEEDR